jgi:hypothetical protein
VLAAQWRRRKDIRRLVRRTCRHPTRGLRRLAKPVHGRRGLLSRGRLPGRFSSRNNLCHDGRCIGPSRCGCLTLRWRRQRLSTRRRLHGQSNAQDLRRRSRRCGRPFGSRMQHSTGQRSCRLHIRAARTSAPWLAPARVTDRHRRAQPDPARASQRIRAYS